MKKKIKDLTFFDVSECCAKYSCVSCPLRFNYRDNRSGYIGCILSVADRMLPRELTEFIEQEVDI